MEKLLKLLNEYERERTINFNSTNNLWITLKAHEYKEEDFDTKSVCAEVISNYFWFIRWLVRNNKIERKTFGELDTITSWYSDFELNERTKEIDYENILLMELSVRGEPILFLSNILK